MEVTRISTYDAMNKSTIQEILFMMGFEYFKMNTNTEDTIKMIATFEITRSCEWLKKKYDNRNKDDKDDENKKDNRGGEDSSDDKDDEDDRLYVLCLVTPKLSHCDNPTRKHQPGRNSWMIVICSPCSCE